MTSQYIIDSCTVGIHHSMVCYIILSHTGGEQFVSAWAYDYYGGAIDLTARHAQFHNVTVRSHARSIF